MSFIQKSRAVMDNWNKEEFKKIHHPDYMFIRETELVTLDDWADKMEKWVVSGDFLKATKEVVLDFRPVCSQFKMDHRFI